MGYGVATLALIEHLKSVAFSNGVSEGALGPLADVVVMALERNGFNEEEVVEFFTEAETNYEE
jgi:hypothetical protein